MEAGLLAREDASGDAETIHVIFRAAHSIKGGAATFGFTAVTDLTHLLETLLDDARRGRRELAPHGPCAAVAGCAPAPAGAPPPPPPPRPPADAAAPAGDWRIAFVPAPSMFMTG